MRVALPREVVFAAVILLRVGSTHVPVASRHDPLRKWINSLEMQIPVYRTEKASFQIGIIGGLCTDFDLEGVTTARVPGPALQIMAEGLTITCALNFTLQSMVAKWIHNEGTVSVTIGRGTNIKGSIWLTPDQHDLALPLEVNASDCSGKIVLDGIRFSEGILSDFAELVMGTVGSYLDTHLAQMICKNVNSIVNNTGSEAVRNMSTDIRAYLATKSHSPPPPVPMPSDVDFSSNPAVRLMKRLVDEVLGNMSSPYNLNSLAIELLGPGGSFSLADLGIPPIHFPPILVGGLATINASLIGLGLGGFNKWSTVYLNPLHPQQMAFEMVMKDFVANASLGLVIAPTADPSSPIRGDVLAEHFDLNLVLWGLGMGATGFLAVNATHLGQLTSDQLASSSCLAPAVRSAIQTDANLSLDLVAPSLVMKTGSQLERDVDSMFTQAVSLVLEQFAPATATLGHHAVAVTLRDALNAKVQSFLHAPMPCDDPTPIYANAVLEYVAACFATICLVLVLVVVQCHASIKSLLLRKQRGSPRELSLPSVARSSTAPADSLHDALTTAPTPSCASTNHGVHGWDCLAMHPRISYGARIGLPLLIVGTMLLFISSNASVGVSIQLSITVDGEEVADFPPLFEFSLIGSCQEMWQGGTYPLAILIFLFSGVWPYGKLIMMLWCWFVPTKSLSVNRRNTFLNFLDAYGKWSVVDSFVMVLFMVAFDFDLPATKLPEEFQAILRDMGSTPDFNVYVEPTMGFHNFLIASILSLIAGHAMTACHRYAMQIGEFGASEVSTGGRQRLCNAIRPPGYWAGKRFVFGPVIAVSVSLVLVLIGIFFQTFEFRFLGLAGFALGPEDATRPFSVVSLAQALPWSSPTPNNLGIRALQVSFIAFTCIFVVAYHCILIILWVAPLSNKRQRHCYVAAQVLNAWCALDVFALSVLVSVLQIRQFALFIVGSKCDLINELLAKPPLVGRMGGIRTCFDVETEIGAGYWLLGAAALISGVTGHVMLHRVTRAFCIVDGATTPPPRGDDLAAGSVEAVSRTQLS